MAWQEHVEQPDAGSNISEFVQAASNEREWGRRSSWPSASRSFTNAAALMAAVPVSPEMYSSTGALPPGV